MTIARNRQHGARRAAARPFSCRTDDPGRRSAVAGTRAARCRRRPAPRRRGARSPPSRRDDTPAVRRFEAPAAEPPTAHLLSNGSYGVMLTPTGAGYSRWRDLAITRWRPEATQSRPWLVPLPARRDHGRAVVRVAPTGPARPGTSSAVFCEHHAAFTHHAAPLTTATEIVVSAEDDAEARRVTLTNTGRTPARDRRDVLCRTCACSGVCRSCASGVLEDVRRYGLSARTRRHHRDAAAPVAAPTPRSGPHISLWLRAMDTAPVQVETDRARFIGRGRDLRDAAMIDQRAVGHHGHCAGPVFSIRRRVSVPGGGTTRVTFWTMVADSSDDTSRSRRSASRPVCL